MTIAFVSGPFRAADAVVKRLQQQRAETLARQLWAHGIAAICPHANSGHFEGEAPEHTFLRGYLELVGRSDCVVTTEGWQESAGARAEVAEALFRNIPVYHSLEQCLARVGGQLVLPL